MLGNGAKIHINSIGFGLLNVVDDCSFSLTNLLHAHKAFSSLISINKIFHDNNVFVEFYSYGFCVNDLISRKVKLERANKKGLYEIHSDVVNGGNFQQSGYLVSLPI